ncbi:MAG: ABC transporter permease [Alkalibacterium sp.]|nr:ABC transporter permease [Alkalibacterium sp.]
MKHNMSFKLAVSNIKANKQIYLPFVVASAITVAMFFMIVSLLSNAFVESRQESLVPLFKLGSGVIAVFSLIFIFYANSFLMKRRKKEIGLYNILGMEKRHIARIIGTETMLTFLVSVLTGLLTGIVLGQLTFYAINFILILPDDFVFSISLVPVALTVVLFMAIFLVTYSYNILNIQFSNPIELLKGGNAGEKEPKSSPILFLLGLMSLGGGYGISLTIDDPMQAFFLFFAAVLLVIIGTYLLFNAGTIIILKWLKKKSTFYYTPGPFISISGMLYRMKQHATGLANICVLSVMVLISVSTTVALYSGAERMIEAGFVNDNSLSIMNIDDTPVEEFEATTVNNIIEMVEQRTAASSVEMEELQTYKQLTIYDNQIKNDAFIYTRSGQVDFDDETSMVNTRFISLDDYNDITGQNRDLNSEELLYYESLPVLSGDTLEIEGIDYSVTRLDSPPEAVDVQVEDRSNVLIVFSDEEILSSTINQFNDYEAEYVEELYYEAFWNTSGSREEKLVYANELDELFSDPIDDAYAFFYNKEVFRVNYYDITGGFLFLGIYLGFLFIIGTVLITYFKQISEGYEDRVRIQAMQKVGLDSEMTKKATRSQVIWMFVLPLVVAIMHTAVAYPLLYQMLSLFSFVTHSLLVTTLLIVSLVFSLIYGIVYKITSRIYLNIVE